MSLLNPRGHAPVDRCRRVAGNLLLQSRRGNDMKETLVVYHSRTGHTRRVARALAGRLDADLEEVETRTSAPGVLGWVRSGFEAVAGVEPPIREGRHDPSRYRRVVIGAPVWVGRLPGPMRSWVRQHP
ncbi:MAG: hypothetical protein ACOVQT_02400, partial [Rubrivivax sp.]